MFADLSKIFPEAQTMLNLISLKGHQRWPTGVGKFKLHTNQKPKSSAMAELNTEAIR